jgi:hypothetical protein
MNKCLIYSLFLFVFTSATASAQDLDSLKDRATRIWALRLEANKSKDAAAAQALRSKAAEFIEKETRSNAPMHETVQEATVAALEFTADKSRILVTTKAKTFIPGIGNAEQSIVEAWVWKGGNWFIHTEPGVLNSLTQVNGATSAITGRQTFNFQLVDKKIELGTHKQGDKITGTVRFAAIRSELQSLRARGLEGFRIGETRWIDDKNGEFDFTFDSSLTSQDIEATVVLEAMGPERVFERLSAVEKLSLVGRIEGKFQISQLPQTPESERGRFVELEIKNVGNASFRVEHLRPLDGHSIAPDTMPPPLAPGQSAKLKISYPTQATLTDGEVMFEFSQGVLPSNSVLFRIQGPVAQGVGKLPVAPDRSQVDAAVQRAIQEAGRARIGQ